MEGATGCLRGARFARNFFWVTCQKFKKWRGARARARLFSRLRNFAGGNASEKFKKNLHCLDSASLFRTVSFSCLPERTSGSVALWRSGANTKTTGPGNLYFSP